MRRLGDVGIPRGGAAFGIGLRHRPVTAAPPLDGSRIPDVNVSAVIQPHVTKPIGVWLHRAALDEKHSVDRHQCRRVLELPEPPPLGNLAFHLRVKRFEHGDARRGPLLFAGLHVLHEHWHEHARTIHPAIRSAGDVSGVLRLNALKVRVASHRLARDGVERGIGEVA